MYQSIARTRWWLKLLAYLSRAGSQRTSLKLTATTPRFWRQRKIARSIGNSLSSSTDTLAGVRESSGRTVRAAWVSAEGMLARRCYLAERIELPPLLRRSWIGRTPRDSVAASFQPVDQQKPDRQCCL